MILSFVNHKGGVAKTTTAVNVGAALAKLGHRTLIVDLDSQGSASMSLGISRAELSPSAADVLLDSTSIQEAIRRTSTEKLDLLTGETRLANADLAWAETKGREAKLKRALDAVRDEYAYILVDCPPSLSLLVVNALVASDGYFVPLVPQYLALEGLANLLDAVQRLEVSMGVRAKMLGLIVTMADYRNRITTELVGMLRERFGANVCGVDVRVNVRLSEAPSHGQHIHDYAPSSSGAEAYVLLAREIIGRCKGRKDGPSAKRPKGNSTHHAIAKKERRAS